MPLAGFVAANGELDFGHVVLAGNVGAALVLRRALGRRSTGLSSTAVSRYSLHAWCRPCRLFLAGRHGTDAARAVLIYSAIRTVLWTGLLAASGFWLEESYTLVADSVDRASNIILGPIVSAIGTGWALRRDLYAVYLAARDRRVP
jgi:membrane protein DedA with SNARE-associated domain